MSRFLLLLSQVVSLFLSARASSELKEPTCQGIRGYNVCHYKRVLVKVTDRRYNEDLLYISNLNLTAIQEDTFKNVSTTHMFLKYGNRLSVLKRESFRGLPNLRYLHLDRNMISLSAHLFAELRHLKLLSLNINNISWIPKDSFAGLSNLRSLRLYGNDIVAVETESFSNLNPRLVRLNLNNNKISSVAPGSFAGLTKLKFLFLTGNRLASLPSDAFRGLNKLEYLCLNDNRITSVSRSLFRDLVGLKQLHLHENEISALEPETFRDLSQLEILLLYGNKLSHIVVGTFAGLSKLEYIYLPDNNMHTVDGGTFADLVKLKKIEFTNNNFSAWSQILISKVCADEKSKSICLCNSKIKIDLRIKSCVGI